MSNSAKRFNQTFSAAETASSGDFSLSDLSAVLQQVKDEKRFLNKPTMSFCDMPQYWGVWHSYEASFWAERLNLSHGEAERVLKTFMESITTPATFWESHPTDEVGVWGPSIGMVLATAKTMGAEYLKTFCLEIDFKRYYHLGEAFFWVRPQYKWVDEKKKLMRRFAGMSSRKFYFWKLMQNLSFQGVSALAVPYTILKGVDKLGAKNFRIARAMLKKYFGRYSSKEDRVTSEDFFLELSQFIKGKKPLDELLEWVPKGDLWTLFDMEELRPLYHEKISERGLYSDQLARDFIFSLTFDSSTSGQMSAVDFLKFGDDIFHWAVEGFKTGRFSTWDEVMEYKEISIIVDETDGVRVWIDPELDQTRFNIAVRSGWDGFRKKMYFCQQAGTGRTYHVKGSEVSSVKDCARLAIKAWRKQADLEKEQMNLVSFMEGDEGFIPLVFFQDSREAGNCAPGIRSYMEEKGWIDREFVPALWLVSDLDRKFDGGYRRVYMTAVKIYRDWHKKVA